MEKAKHTKGLQVADNISPQTVRAGLQHVPPGVVSHFFQRRD